LASNDTWLLEYRKNHHSQTGEDGVVEKILGALPATDRWCVEFGAGDGERFSNTCHLIGAHGYSAVLIEPDAAKFRALDRRYQAYPGVHRFRRSIGLGHAGARGLRLPLDRHRRQRLARLEVAVALFAESGVHRVQPHDPDRGPVRAGS
jgi:hypothetical protein